MGGAPLAKVFGHGEAGTANVDVGDMKSDAVGCIGCIGDCRWDSGGGGWN